MLHRLGSLLRESLQCPSRSGNESGDAESVCVCVCCGNTVTLKHESAGELFEEEKSVASVFFSFFREALSSSPSPSLKPSAFFFCPKSEFPIQRASVTPRTRPLTQRRRIPSRACASRARWCLGWCLGWRGRAPAVPWGCRRRPHCVG